MMQRSDILAKFGEAGYEMWDCRYDPDVFGCWYVVIMSRGRQFRVIYEGRDGLLLLQEATAEFGWRDVKQSDVRELSELERLGTGIDMLVEFASDKSPCN